ncbi:hypothetical protein DFH09DRAFT_1174523 [Mycena vulgaris]|nr:hypothetical protein DFH09DRAFT_1174523 [Mycena vulgaris]
MAAPTKSLNIVFTPEVSDPDILAAGTLEKRHIKCSAALVLRWDEYHRDILPIMFFPSLDSNSPRTLVYSNERRFRRITDFGTVVEQHLRTYYLTVWPSQSRTPTQQIIDDLATYSMTTSEDAVVELRMWACMVAHVRMVTVVWLPYTEKLKRRCSVWDRICVAASTFVDSIPTAVPTSLLAPHPSESSPQPLLPSSSSSGSSGSVSEASSEGALLPSSPKDATDTRADPTCTSIHVMNKNLRHRVHHKSLAL